MMGAALDYYYNTGGKKYKATTRPSVSWIQGLYSTKNQLILEGFSSTYLANERMYLYFRGGYADTYEKFWGYSRDMYPNKSYLNYTFKRLYFNPKFFVKIKKNFFVGPIFNYSQFSELETDTIVALSKGALPTMSNSRIIGYGIGLLKDKRNNQFSPTLGHYMELSAIMNRDINNRSNYVFYLADARKYHTFNKHNLMYQLLLSKSSGNVPIAEQFRLGGPNLMRGMFQGRLRDDNMAAAQVEYRYALRPWLKCAAFISSGQTFGNIEKSNIAYAGGTGLRFLFNKEKSVYLRTDIAVSSKGEFGYYLKVGDAF